MISTGYDIGYKEQVYYSDEPISESKVVVVDLTCASITRLSYSINEGEDSNDDDDVDDDDDVEYY